MKKNHCPTIKEETYQWWFLPALAPLQVTLKLKTAFVGNPENLMPSKIWFQQHFLFVYEHEWTQGITEVGFNPFEH